MISKPSSLCFLAALLFLSVVEVSAQCIRDPSKTEGSEKIQAFKFKLTAIFSILVAGILGVCFPILGKKWPVLQPENNIFFLIKSFAAGVILATAFVHILPDAFESLSSPCLSQTVWEDFPFAGLIAMGAAIGTMVIDTFATSYFKRVHCKKSRQVDVDEEVGGEQHQGHVDVHTHATHGHAHGSGSVFSIDQALEKEFKSSHDLIRHRVISQVLELGIVVHSVIIGISLGASENPDIIKPLVAALTFHQLFEGMGLGGCISQARFDYRAIAAMVVFFSLMTPVGIVIGMGLSSFYNENSQGSLVVEGALNSASAGILIYMSLVDLIAADNVNPILLSKPKLQLGAMLFLLLGAASMSLLAKWA